MKKKILTQNKPIDSAKNKVITFKNNKVSVVKTMMNILILVCLLTLSKNSPVITGENTGKIKSVIDRNNSTLITLFIMLIWFITDYMFSIK